MRLALLDGDMNVYASGFASDAAAKREYVSQHGSEEGFDIRIHHEPLNYAIHGMTEHINSIVEHAHADDYVVYLSHPVNFREQFYPQYKRNRPDRKPFWHAELAEYLLDRNAVYSELGDEADDALGMAQMRARADGRETIICTKDKDLDMIPGLHYNYSKTKLENGVYNIEDPEGLRLFYSQMISGDATDNIPGLYRKLGMKAEKRWFYPLENMTTHLEMYEYVLDVYQGDKEFVDLNGKLLWIKRDSRFFEAPVREAA